MRFMMIVRATKESESGALPDQPALEEMGKYNEELMRAGSMLAGEGLAASSQGVRVRFSNGNRTVASGPFPDTIAGFWLIKAKSQEEAIEWARRVPFNEGEIEIRRVMEPEDFPGDGEWRERERAFRERLKA